MKFELQPAQYLISPLRHFSIMYEITVTWENCKHVYGIN